MAQSKAIQAQSFYQFFTNFTFGRLVWIYEATSERKRKPLPQKRDNILRETDKNRNLRRTDADCFRNVGGQICPTSRSPSTAPTVPSASTLTSSSTAWWVLGFVGYYRLRQTFWEGPYPSFTPPLEIGRYIIGREIALIGIWPQRWQKFSNESDGTLRAPLCLIRWRTSRGRRASQVPGWGPKLVWGVCCNRISITLTRLASQTIPPPSIIFTALKNLNVGNSNAFPSIP